jgi:hypothetical protein
MGDRCTPPPNGFSEAEICKKIQNPSIQCLSQTMVMPLTQPKARKFAKSTTLGQVVILRHANLIMSVVFLGVIRNTLPHLIQKTREKG